MSHAKAWQPRTVCTLARHWRGVMKRVRCLLTPGPAGVHESNDPMFVRLLRRNMKQLIHLPAPFRAMFRSPPCHGDILQLSRLPGCWRNAGSPQALGLGLHAGTKQRKFDGGIKAHGSGLAIPRRPSRTSSFKTAGRDPAQCHNAHDAGGRTLAFGGRPPDHQYIQGSPLPRCLHPAASEIRRWQTCWFGRFIKPRMP